MAVRAMTERVVECLHGRWIYGACISVVFALRGNMDESWRWRKERTVGVDPTGSRKKYKAVESVHSRMGRHLRSYRCAVGVVAKDKVEVLESCVVAWGKGGHRRRVFVEELQRASIVGCSVMRAAGDSVLLLFSSSDNRRVFLDMSDLDQWFDRVTVWKPELRLDSRCVWISVVGLPMHLWPSETFANIASLWGRLVRVEDNTVEPQSFERARFLMETSWMERIEETVEILEGEDSVVRIQIQEVEIIHSHDIVCSCERESDDGKNETRVSDLQEDQVTRMNPLYCTSGGEDREREVRGMAEEFDIVGVVCREVIPELRLWEPATS
ncbi:hypothetical protein V6N13_133887 [Hibiscus sabdariffa]